MGTRSGHKSAARRSAQSGATVRQVVGVEPDGYGPDGMPRFRAVDLSEGYANLDGTPYVDLGMLLGRMSHLRMVLADVETSVVELARAQGMSWRQVGDLLDCAPETARKNYGDLNANDAKAS